MIKCFFFPFFFSGGLHLQHMEVPRLGVKSELQLPAYITSTAMLELSFTCNLHCSSQQHQILNPLSKARDRTCILMNTSQICFCWATMGTPSLHIKFWCVVFPPSFVSRWYLISFLTPLVVQEYVIRLLKVILYCNLKSWTAEVWFFEPNFKDLKVLEGLGPTFMWSLLKCSAGKKLPFVLCDCFLLDTVIDVLLNLFSLTHRSELQLFSL